MAAYKDRLTKDLERWIAAGLVAQEQRQAILATVPDTRRLDAATAMAWVGALLMGAAVIAFIAANWDGLSRLTRFGLVLAFFVAAVGAGAWAAHKQRTMFANIALTVSALVFAAAVGLTGQIFDIAGQPRAALYIAGIAALALALAGRAPGAACVGLVLIAFGDFEGRQWFAGIHSEAPWMLLAAPLGAWLALRWSSAPLAHLSALALIYCGAWFAMKTEAEAGAYLFLAIVLAAMAAGARWLYLQARSFAGVFYGWFTAGALLFLAVAGYLPWFGDQNSDAAGLMHRLVWLIASGGVIALGRLDRHLLVTAIGVLSMIAAVCALLADLGLDLLAAAGVFLLCALAALAAGLLLRRSKADA